VSSAALSLRLPREWLEYSRLYFARLMGLSFGTVLTIASARVLEPAGRGEFVALSAAAVLGAQTLNLGLSSSLAVLFSRRPSRIGFYRVYLVYLTVGWATLLSALGVAQLWAHAPLSRAWWVPLAVWVPLQLLGLYQGAALVALQDAKWLSRIELAGRCCALVLGGTALLILGSDLAAFVAAVIAGDALIAVLGAIRLSRVSKVRTARPQRAARFFRSALRLGLRAFPPLVLVFLLIKSDILLLRLMRGAAETGVYSIASQVVDVALILPSTIGTLVLASVVRSSQPAVELLRVLRPAALLIVGLALGMLVFGHWAIVLLFGRPFENAYPALVLLLPAFVCLALQSLISQYFAARGFPLFISIYWLLGLVTNLTLNLLLIPRFGLLAAAASSSVAYALVFGLMWRRFRRDYSVEVARTVQAVSGRPRSASP